MIKFSFLILFGTVNVTFGANVDFELVPGDSVVQHGGAYLLKGTEALSPTGVDSWLLNGQTQNVDDMQFGLQVKAFASSTCGAVESFDAKFDAHTLINQADIIFTVSAGDKYFSVFADWDGQITMGNGVHGGIFTYPDCQSTSTFPSLGTNIDNANTLFDGVTWSSSASNNWKVLRERLCGGNQFGCPIQTTDRIGNTESYTISIDNDVINDELTFGFSAGTFNFECTFGDSFDENTDIQINLTPDWDNEEWGIEKVTFSVTCDDHFEVFEDCEVLDKTCRVSGDPHFTTWDNHRQHYQGGGENGAYYDYITECLDENNNPLNNLPFNIAAKQSVCNTKYTCIDDILLELDDGHKINFPGVGIPTYVDTGADARGSYSFSNTNGEVNYEIGYDSFSISFVTNEEQTAQLEFVFVGKTFTAKTSNCLLDKLCGLCGYFDGDKTNDFTRCDNGNVIDNSDTENMRTMSIDAWERTLQYGDTCCRDDLGNCEPTDPTTNPPPDTDCLDNANEICKEAWFEYCGECELTNNVDYDEFILDCEVDICDAAQNDLGTCNDFYCAEENGWLDTTSNKCQVECPDVFDGCELKAEALCFEFYEFYCKYCDNDSDATSLWINECSSEVCSNSECGSSLLLDNFLVSDAFEFGCLSTSFNTCAAQKINSVNQYFTGLGYQSM